MDVELEAGRGLDALIATEVMGWTHDREKAYQVLKADAGFDVEYPWTWVTGWRHSDGREHLHDFPPAYYSTTYEGMGLVLERMRGLGWGWDLEYDVGYENWEAFLTSWQWDAVCCVATTLPHAVCLAALKAVRSVAS